MAETGAKLICFDGPKGTGKTSLLDEVWRRLEEEGKVVAVKLTEKVLDPFREEALTLIKGLREWPDERLERRVCEKLAEGRRWITENVLDELMPYHVALIDRWYPSDAAFRRMLPFDEVRRINLAAGVRDPDLVVGVTCDPALSWARAASRERGLNSLVIRSLDDQRGSTDAFERAMIGHGWMNCRNDGDLADAAKAVVGRIYQVAL